MVTLVGTESKLIDLLVDLIKLDYDAMDAYNEAIQRLKNKEWIAQIREFRDDHQRHTQNLRPFVAAEGGHAPTHGDAKSLLTTGKVAVAALIGDNAILAAMKTNEEDTNTAYERAVAHKGISADLKRVLNTNLSDERRHRAWIVDTLKE